MIKTMHSFEIRFFVEGSGKPIAKMELTEDGTREDALAVVREKIRANTERNPYLTIQAEVWEKVSLDSELVQT